MICDILFFLYPKLIFTVLHFNLDQTYAFTSKICEWFEELIYSLLFFPPVFDLVLGFVLKECGIKYSILMFLSKKIPCNDHTQQYSVSQCSKRRKQCIVGIIFSSGCISLAISLYFQQQNGVSGIKYTKVAIFRKMKKCPIVQRSGILLCLYNCFVDTKGPSALLILVFFMVC